MRKNEGFEISLKHALDKLQNINFFEINLNLKKKGTDNRNDKNNERDNNINYKIQIN